MQRNTQQKWLISVTERHLSCSCFTLRPYQVRPFPFWPSSGQNSRDLSPPCTAQLHWGLKGLGAGSPEITEKERASWRTKGGRRERKLPPTSTSHCSPRKKILPDWFLPMEKAQKWLCIILWTLCTCLPNHQIAGGFFSPSNDLCFSFLCCVSNYHKLKTTHIISQFLWVRVSQHCC